MNKFKEADRLSMVKVMTVRNVYFDRSHASLPGLSRNSKKR